MLYLKYFADFPIEKRRLARILKSMPHVYIDNYGQKVSFISDDLRIIGTLYGVEGNGKNPGIIFLHGSSPYGRKLALYRILGRKFAECGYITLCIDFRGFGDSEDPSTNGPEIFDFCQDVSNAIDFMHSINDVDTSKIYLIGHSLGGNAAFVQGAKDQRVKKVVAIGPSRRVKERVLPELDQIIDEGIQYVDAHNYRMSRDMKLKGRVSVEVIKNSILSMLIDNHKAYYAQERHKPVLLVDGDLENEQDQLFLKLFYEQLTPPTDYKTFKNVAHYHNTINWDGRSLVLYDPQAINEIVDFIDNWILE